MKKIISTIGFLLLLLITNQSFGQTVLWTEDFEGTPDWSLSNPSGTNGVDPNIWEINDTEGGVTPPGCGTGGNGDATLHVTCSGFLCGFLGTGSLYNAGTTSNIRAQYNSAISTLGQSNLSLNFDWIGIGEAGDDFTTIQYSIDGGTSWVDIQIMTGGTLCGGGQGQWANSIIALPVACENQADLRFAFNWTNSNNNAGTDPPFAVNNIELTTPSGGNTVTADFTLSPTTLTICQNSSITFTNQSTASGTTINSYAWAFATGTPAIANTTGPHTVVFNTIGTHVISLTVGDGTITDIKNDVSVIVVAAPNAGADDLTPILCNNTTLDLNTLLSGADTGGTWAETSGTPSGQFTVGTGVLDGNGLVDANTYDFTYTVTGSSPCSPDVSNFTVTIDDCSVASITAGITTAPNTLTICQGTSLTFTDASTTSVTTITNWSWDFDGQATNSTIQNPPAVTFNTAGSFDIILTANDLPALNTDTETITIIVNATSNAGSNDTENLCNNTTLDLNSLLIGADTGGTWAETSGTMSGQFTDGTGILDGNGLTATNVFTFTYTVTGSAPCPDAISTFTITITDCSAGSLNADFTQDIPSPICVGTAITFTDVSTATGTTITTWGWSFDGGLPILGTAAGTQVYTFNTPGSIDVILAISDGTLNDTKTITVVVNDLPTVTAAALPSTTVCTGDQVTITGGGATTYTWDNGIFDGTAFTPTVGSTTYTVTGTDANSCINTANVTINVADCVPMIAGFKFNDNICLGSCINFTDTTSGTPVSWLWDFGTNASQITSTDQNPGPICFNTVGVYTIQLTVTDASGGTNSTTNSITVFDSPTITAFHDTLIDLGGEAELISTTSNVGDILWTPNTYYIDCETCPITYTQPQVNTDYYVTITDLNGCTGTDTVKVMVNFIEGIGVPQAFSPNADGNNDQLTVKGYGISNMKFKVYNRYGQLVFETTDQNHGWDGSFNGSPENPGVFVWTLEYTLLNFSKGLLKGNTTLIR